MVRPQVYACIMCLGKHINIIILDTSQHTLRAVESFLAW